MERIETIIIDNRRKDAREVAAERVHEIEREHALSPVGPWFQGRDKKSKRMVILTSYAEVAARKILDENLAIDCIDVFAMPRIDY